ncbi:MAG: hypothetical protein H6707_16535 [Deltaproteobacteria bacterium]|nr:hypothetical protein [Deltaproteobacteria bacterium]
MSNASRKLYPLLIAVVLGGCSPSPREQVVSISLQFTRGQSELNGNMVTMGDTITAKAFALAASGNVLADVTHRLRLRDELVFARITTSSGSNALAFRAIAPGSATFVVDAGAVAREVEISSVCPQLPSCTVGQPGCGTTHAGVISASETWRATDGPHLVGANVTVKGAESCTRGDATCVCDGDSCQRPVTLTIEGCTQVVFAAGTQLKVGDGEPGALRVLGGGASDWPAKTATVQTGIVQFVGQTATAGHWAGVELSYKLIDKAGVTDPTRLSGLQISHAGAGGHAALRAAFTQDGPTPWLHGLRVANNAAAGVELGEKSALDAASTRFRITENAVPWDTAANATRWVQPITSDGLTDYSGNTRDVIEIRGGKISATSVWDVTSIPYRVTGDVEVSGPLVPAPLLFIAPGVTLRFVKGTRLAVGMTPGQQGLITAGRVATVGTNSDTPPVTLTSDEATPAAGDWVGLIIGPYTPPTPLLRKVTIEYAGGASGLRGFDGDFTAEDDRGALFMLNPNGTSSLADLTLRHSAGYGVVRGFFSASHAGFSKFIADLETNKDTLASGIESDPSPLQLTLPSQKKSTLALTPTASELLGPQSCDATVTSPEAAWTFTKNATQAAAVGAWYIAAYETKSDRLVWLEASLPGSARAAGGGTAIGTEVIAYRQPERCSAPDSCPALLTSCNNLRSFAQQSACASWEEAGCAERIHFVVYGTAAGGSSIDLTTAQTRQDVETALTTQLVGQAVAGTIYRVPQAAP